MSAERGFDFRRCAKCDRGCTRPGECLDRRHAFAELNRWACLQEAAALEGLARLRKAETPETKERKREPP